MSKQKLGPKQKRWVKDLKSGQYPKGKDRLIDRRGDYITGFCCLGVLAHTQCDLPWEKYPLEKTLRNTEWKKLKLRSKRGALRVNAKISGQDFCALDQINDAAGKSHKWIGRFIEDNADIIFRGPA